MEEKTKYTESEIRNMQELYDRELTLPCIILCAILFLILGILPIVPNRITIFCRPLFIFVASFTIYCSYPLRSFRWQIALSVYFLFTFIFNRITRSNAESFISHELFILFFLFASTRVWSRREIHQFLDTLIFSCDVQAIVVFFSNSMLLHAGGQHHINYLWVSTNRNPIAFAIVPGAIASLLKITFSKTGVKASIFRFYWIFSFVLCAYSVFAIGCRSAFYSLCLGIFCIIWERIKRIRNRAEKFIQELLILILVITATAILMRVAAGAYSERLFSIEDTGRQAIWEYAMELIKKKPVFGGGFDYWGSAEYMMGTHNTFITYLLEGGAVAAFLVGIHLLLLGREVMETGSAIPFAFLAETLMHMFTETGMDYYAYLPMIFCLILANYLRYQDNVWYLFNGSRKGY